jgi:hypothetical protein
LTHPVLSPTNLKSHEIPEINYNKICSPDTTLSFWRLWTKILVHSNGDHYYVHENEDDDNEDNDDYNKKNNNSGNNNTNKDIVLL